MRQLFAPGADAILRLAILATVGVLLAAVIALTGYAHSAYVGNVGIAPEQPVPFSHKHHVAELGLDCRNCHQYAATQATAGLPPTTTCMTCHSRIWDQSPMLAPVRDSLAQGVPLHWVRVNRLPDYVYFNHSIHVSKGVGCASCHGAVDTMQLTYAARSFTMAFCLDCHRAPAAALRPLQAVWDMHWQPPPDQAARGKALIAARHIEGPTRLTQCSTCHR